MLYRVRQFKKALFGKVTSEDVRFVSEYLSKEEQELFYKLKVYEQRHCLDVAVKLKDMTFKNQEMIRLGLLHDIGKISYPLNPIEKSIIVVLDKLTKGRIKKYRQLKMVKCYYEHPALGYEILGKLGNYDEAFLYCIKSHHLKEERNEKIKLLQEADDLS